MKNRRLTIPDNRHSTPETQVRPNFFIITGASGGGKSSIIAALKHRGHLCVEEIGRQIVREQLNSGGDGTPWQDPLKFMEILLARSIGAFEEVEESARPVFFDRGIPECLAYFRATGQLGSEQYVQQIELYRYNPIVFITPPWQEIYTTDEERRHGYDYSLEEYGRVMAVYGECGYKLVEVPKSPVEARVQFILSHVLGAAYPVIQASDGRSLDAH